MNAPEILDVFGGSLRTLADAFADNAERFTCDEIEALVRMYALLGHTDDATDLLYCHADGDNETDDDHHAWTYAQCAALVAEICSR